MNPRVSRPAAPASERKHGVSAVKRSGSSSAAQDLLADDVGQADFGSGDQPAAVGGLEQILGEFGELAGAEHRLVAHHQRGDDFLITVIARQYVEPELAERAVEPRCRAAHQREARAGERHAGFEIEPERRADLVMLPDREGEVGPRAVFGDKFVVVLVRALGHVGERQVGDRCEFATLARSASSLA